MASGGKREGAGRKPEGELPKISYSTKLPAAVVAYLKSTENQAKTIEIALTRSASFRRFRKTFQN